VFNREVFEYIPEGFVSLENDVFPKLIVKSIYGMRVKVFFIDIGIPEDYKKFQESLEDLFKLEKSITRFLC